MDNLLCQTTYVPDWGELDLLAKLFGLLGIKHVLSFFLNNLILSLVWLCSFFLLIVRERLTVTIQICSAQQLEFLSPLTVPCEDTIFHLRAIMVDSVDGCVGLLGHFSAAQMNILLNTTYSGTGTGTCCRYNYHNLSQGPAFITEGVCDSGCRRALKLAIEGILLIIT